MPNYKLGKLEYVHDEKTLNLVRFLTALKYPAAFSFDTGKAPFPDHMWGNDDYGDCVLAARANAQIRLERLEQKRTIMLEDPDVISLYKQMTGCVSPGDRHDSGLVMLNAMRQWKNVGWHTHYRPTRNYTIAAYGEVDPMNMDELRASIYMLGGIHFGFALPYAAQEMTNEKAWTYEGQTGPEWEPGSWGGHAVYGIGYDKSSVTIKTWGMNVKVSNSFIKKYCDEAWAVVDNLDSWRTQQTVNVAALTNALHQISGKVNR